jgi:hypothetical protein
MLSQTTTRRPEEGTNKRQVADWPFQSHFLCKWRQGERTIEKIWLTSGSILLPQAAECWNYRCVPPWLVKMFFLVVICSGDLCFILMLLLIFSNI